MSRWGIVLEIEPLFYFLTAHLSTEEAPTELSPIPTYTTEAPASFPELL
jgi:hypothetical protein